MPSPMTNLSTGLSTKPVRLVPDGAGIKNRWSANQDQYVPLSVFFMGVPEEEVDSDALFGLRMPSREKKAPPKEKKASGGSPGGKDQKKKDDDKEKGDDKAKGKTKGNAITTKVQGKDSKAATAAPAAPKGPEREPQPAAAQPKGSEPGVPAKQEGYGVLFGLIRDGYAVVSSPLVEERAERSGAVAASLGRTGMEGKRKRKKERKGPWDKPHKCKYCDASATRDLIWADGRAYIPVCDQHRKRGERRILVKNRDSIAAAKPVVQEGRLPRTFRDIAMAAKRRAEKGEGSESDKFWDFGGGELDDLAASEVERLARGFKQEDVGLHEKKLSDIAGKNQWVRLSRSDLGDDELMQELFRLIQMAYAPIGGNPKFSKASDIPRETSFVLAIDLDEDPEADAALFGKPRAGQKKIIAIGQDLSPAAKKEAFRKFIEMARVGKAFAEVSGAPAHMLLKQGAVTSVGSKEEVERMLGGGKSVDWVGPHPEGKYPDHPNWYYRHVAGKRRLKIMVGKGKGRVEGMTTTANVPTLPVPIGAGDGRKFLDRPDDPKRKKKKRRSLARGLYLLLRQQPG